MAVANHPALPPGASSEGVGQGRCARVLFNSADRPRKKLITKINDLFYVYTFNSTSNAPKTMELHFPCTSRSSHLPSILTYVVAASFWLVVALIIIDRRPFKAAVYFIFYIFLSINSLPQTMGWCPPMRSPTHAPPLQHHPYRFRQLSG
jgi:hypothetical protein